MAGPREANSVLSVTCLTVVTPQPCEVGSWQHAPLCRSNTKGGRGDGGTDSGLLAAAQALNSPPPQPRLMLRLENFHSLSPADGPRPEPSPLGHCFSRHLSPLPGRRVLLLQSSLCVHGDGFQDPLGHPNPRMLESLSRHFLSVVLHPWVQRANCTYYTDGPAEAPPHCPEGQGLALFPIYYQLCMKGTARHPLVSVQGAFSLNIFLFEVPTGREK